MNAQELKQHERWKEQVQFLRGRNQHLERELMTYRPAWHRASVRIDELEQRVEKLAAENELLKQKVKDLTLAARQTPQETDRAAAAPAAAAPAAAAPVKPSVTRRRKRPGRKDGHPAALRPPPDRIDVHQPVPFPKDAAGRESCPRCSACLLELKDRERIVEDIVPSRIVVTCYHTRSGWCPCCRKTMESRASEQPPAANIPHGRLGLNALATAMVLRIRHRLPFRQVGQVLVDLPGLSVSPGAVAARVQRIADWFDGDYEKLMLELRRAPHVHADETGWRTDGGNGRLWAVTSPVRTLYHVDKSRSGKVIRKLPGKAFGGTLVGDFYSAYSGMDCHKQKCLAHLLRELVDCAEESAAFANGPFFAKAKRLIKRMLLLKRQWDTLDDTQYTTRACRLESKPEELAKAEYDEADAERIAKRMRKHQKELTAFLWDKDLDGTNNAAERALRPAVVARKISGGSRSKNGAKSWATLASLMRTAGRQGRRILETVSTMLVAAWASERPPTMPAGP